ncbi:hypothetical protein GS944_21320 [Rhodococcus hoagii]|nr:hypothetical protein [Prescottella equi]
MPVSQPSPSSSRLVVRTCRPAHRSSNVSHFRPSGEPDADYDSYKHHL